MSQLTATPRRFVFRFRSPDDFVHFFRANYGPVHKAFLALDEPGRERLYEDLAALAREHDSAPGPSIAMGLGVSGGDRRPAVADHPPRGG